MKTAILIAVMAIVTMFLRFFPFLMIRNQPPRYISYLGRVLPSAIIGMLVIYCFKDISLEVDPYGIPELVSVVCIVVLQIWKRNSLISILMGTVIYMGMIHVFPHF